MSWRGSNVRAAVNAVTSPSPSLGSEENDDEINNDQFEVPNSESEAEDSNEGIYGIEQMYLKIFANCSCRQ